MTDDSDDARATQTTTTQAASGAEWPKLKDAKLGTFNQPDRNAPGVRLIGWKVPIKYAGISGALFALERIEAELDAAYAAAPVTGTDGASRDFELMLARIIHRHGKGLDAERVRAVLAEWFSDAEGMCRAYDGDLPDKAEIYVVAAKRSRLYLGTYGELRRAALGSGEGTAGASPAGSGSRPSDQAASHPAPAGVDPSRIRQRRDEEGFACEYDPGRAPESDTYTLLWENGARWLVVDRVGRITVGQSPANGSVAQQTTWQALAALGIEARQGRDEGSACESPAPPGATPHPQSPSLSEVEEAPTPDPVGEAKALLAEHDEPRKWANFYRWMAAMETIPRQQAIYVAKADAIEAALATLTASQEQDGEVRS